MEKWYHTGELADYFGASDDTLRLYGRMASSPQKEQGQRLPRVFQSRYNRHFVLEKGNQEYCGRISEGETKPRGEIGESHSYEQRISGGRHRHGAVP